MNVPRDEAPAGTTTDAYAIHETFEGFAVAAGFWTASATCGLKASGAPDLALIAADADAAAAGVFTTNRVQAAPVVYDRDLLSRRAGRIRGIIANAGCANACTGERGLADTRAMAAHAAALLGCEPDQVLVLSTGVIGQPLDMEKVARGIEALRAPAARGAEGVARAIMTTDTRPKVACLDLPLGSGTIRISGFAKGSGMIHPRMATMLAVITTDAVVSPVLLGQALHRATKRSFDCISVDGDMSTNDTVLALASGASGRALEGPLAFDRFCDALTHVAASLARQIARDGEGATRLVEIRVQGARTDAEGDAVATAVARSPLVKTAIHGGDPNWGRILAAAGTSGVPIEPERLSLWFGHGHRRIQVVANGASAGFDAAAASATLRDDPAVITLDLGQGGARVTHWTCDLSADYVAINAHYTT